MSDDAVAELLAATDSERDALVVELVPRYATSIDTAFGRHAVRTIPRLISRGWSNEEIIDDLQRHRGLESFFPDGRPNGLPVWREGPEPSVREIAFAGALLAALSGGRPTRRPPKRLATTEQAIAAYEKHGSERKAAGALGMSKTQLRRMRLGEK